MLQRRVEVPLTASITEVAFFQVGDQCVLSSSRIIYQLTRKNLQRLGILGISTLSNQSSLGTYTHCAIVSAADYTFYAYSALEIYI